MPRFFVDMRALAAAPEGSAGAVVRALLGRRRIQRAIGVIYRPDTEFASHYFPACLTDQFDAAVFVDVTRAVEPLEHAPPWTTGAPHPHPADEETWPTGL